jgi:ATP-dependent DNA helicase RecG
MTEPRHEPEQLSFPIVRKTELIPVDSLYAQADQSLLNRLRSEDRRYERKSAGIQAQALGDYFSILANTAPDGGLIAIGVDDDGGYSGCANAHPKHMNELERAGDVYCPDARYDYKTSTHSKQPR